jgi:DNA-directed RNA polymerase subunit RPC12/RpoP
MISLKQKIQKLNSLLGFIGVDLASLSEQERMYWWALFFWLYSGNLLMSMKRANLSGATTFKIPRVELPIIQDALKTFVEEHILKLPGSHSILRLPNFERQLTADDTFKIDYVQMVKASDSNAPDLDLLKNDFAALLDGLPSDCIKKCGECGKLFVHISKKVKIYCSPKCSFKYLSRKRREELKKHPRKYRAFLKTQKEKMRKIYEEKKKAEVGPNVVIRRNGKRPNRKED